MYLCDMNWFEIVGFNTSTRQRGFTLIEVITVLCIAGILSAMATPFFIKILPNSRLRAAAMDLHGNMQKMRIQAIRTHRSTAVIFDDSNCSYLICYDYDETAQSCSGVKQQTVLSDYKSGVTLGKGGANLSDGVDGSIPSDYVEFTDFDGKTIVFDRTGLCNAGEVYLENKYQDTAYAITSLSSGIIRNLQWRGGDTWQ